MSPASDRRQARVVHRYIAGLLHAAPMLDALIVRETHDAIELANGITLEIHTANYRAIRGYTVVAAICDELAFWPTDDAANPDTEILNALRPAMATVPHALLLCISSPYARRGELWRAYQKHFGHPGDVLVWRAKTRTMNPSVSPTVIARAYADDQVAAAAEYGAEFRHDVEAFLSAEAIDAVTLPGRLEVPPVVDVAYTAFVDPAGGSGPDSMTLAIAHAESRDGRTVAVLDALRDVGPPFSPDAVVGEFAATLRTYRVARVVGDRCAGDWPRDALRRAGVEYQVSERTTSEIYRDTLPLVNSAQVELLDHPRLRAQLASLERRVGRGGRDRIDHPPAAHGDVCNSACGALMVAHRRATRLLEGEAHDPVYKAAYAKNLAKYMGRA